LVRGRPLAGRCTLPPMLQRARSPAVHASGSVQLPGLPVSVQRHLGDPSPRDASSAKNLAAGHVSHGHLSSWRQCPSVVSVARNWLPKRLAPGASEPLSGRNRLSLESAQSRGPGAVTEPAGGHGCGTSHVRGVRAMKRAPRNAIYRLDHFRHAMNPGKEARVRAFLRVWREVAVLESRHQWRRFFETGSFEISGPARFGHLVMAYQHQMIRDQVAGQLEGWIRSRQKDFTRLVARSNLDEVLRHQLHTVNRWKAWFSRGPVQMKDGTPVPDEARVLARRIMRQIMARHRRPSFKRIGMRIDVRGVKIQQARTSRAFSLWLDRKSTRLNSSH